MRRAARAAKLWCSEARDLGLSVDAQSDPGEFMMWLLHTLHQDLSGKKKGGKSIINRCFQGELEVTTVGGDADAAPDKMPFYMLALDLPPAPLFQAGSSSTSIHSRAAQHTCYFEAAAALRRPPPPSLIDSHRFKPLSGSRLTGCMSHVCACYTSDTSVKPPLN